MRIYPQRFCTERFLIENNNRSEIMPVTKEFKMIDEQIAILNSR